ncbi:MAG: hypothetical protein OXF88_06240 [Rhodobacteraceae bacterium]|nr:hypothetical protein [Paracoccaceae bacterium]
MTLFQPLVGEVVRPGDSGRMQGCLPTVANSSATFGSVAGRFLTHHADWRPVFRVNIPVAIVAVLFPLKQALLPVPNRVPVFYFLGWAVLSTSVTSMLLLLLQIRALPSVIVVAVIGLPALFFNRLPKRASQSQDAGVRKKTNYGWRIQFDATCFKTS